MWAAGLLAALPAGLLGLFGCVLVGRRAHARRSREGRAQLFGQAGHRAWANNGGPHAFRNSDSHLFLYETVYVYRITLHVRIAAYRTVILSILNSKYFRLRLDGIPPCYFILLYNRFDYSIQS